MAEKDMDWWLAVEEAETGKKIVVDLASAYMLSFLPAPKPGAGAAPFVLGSLKISGACEGVPFTVEVPCAKEYAEQAMLAWTRHRPRARMLWTPETREPA